MEKHSLRAIVEQRSLIAEGPMVIFIVQHDLEGRFIKENKPWLTEKVRQVLNQPKVCIDYRIDPTLVEAEEERIRREQPEYRIQLMLDRNPALLTLIKRFGLQPE